MKALLSSLLLSCVLLILAGGAWAIKWESIGKHPQGEMFIETEQVERDGHLVTYWGKRVFAEKQQSVKKDFWYTEQRVRHEIDCKARTVTITGLVLLNEKGEIQLQDLDMRQGPKPIEPGGFIVKGVDRFCPVVTNNPAKDRPLSEAGW